MVGTEVFHLKGVKPFEVFLISGEIGISRGDDRLVERNSASVRRKEGFELRDIGCNRAGGMAWNLQDGDLQIPESNSIPLANGLACHILSPFEIKG